MSKPSLDPNAAHYAFGLLLAVAGAAFAYMGWQEALDLNVDRSAMFSRAAGPIASARQPMTMGIVSMAISGTVLIGIARRWRGEDKARSFLALLAWGMAAWFVFGVSGIVAGLEASRILAEREATGEPA